MESQEGLTVERVRAVGRHEVDESAALLARAATALLLATLKLKAPAGPVAAKLDAAMSENAGLMLGGFFLSECRVEASKVGRVRRSRLPFTCRSWKVEII